MPDVPGQKWVWNDEPPEGAIVRGEDSNGLYKRIGFLWFNTYSKEAWDDKDGLEWHTLMELEGELHLWRPVAVGDRVWGRDLAALPLMTFMVNEDTGHAVCKIKDNEWYGPGKDGPVSVFEWTAFVGGNYKVVWMPEEN